MAGPGKALLEPEGSRYRKKSPVFQLIGGKTPRKGLTLRCRPCSKFRIFPFGCCAIPTGRPADDYPGKKAKDKGAAGYFRLRPAHHESPV